MESESRDLKTLENLNSLQIFSLREEEDEEIGKRIEEEEGEADDDDDDEDEEEEDVAVTLGFVEKPKNPQSLLRHLFPSKAGGVPAWLDPVDLPTEKSRNCGFCGEPLQFLLQVYAPISEKESAFHRTLFIFMCTSMTCLLQDQHEQWKRKPEKPSRSVKVFRCQLPRSNTFYSSNPPKHDGTDKPSGAGGKNESCTGQIHSKSSTKSSELDSSKSEQDVSICDGNQVSEEPAPVVCSLCRDPDSNSPVSYLILLQKSQLASFVERGPPSWEEVPRSDKKHLSIAIRGMTDPSCESPLKQEKTDVYLQEQDI